MSEEGRSIDSSLIARLDRLRTLPAEAQTVRVKPSIVTPSTGVTSVEAFILPLIFLTVFLMGGFRVATGGAGVRLLPPPLISLVLALLLVGVLIRGSLLLPRKILSGRRSALANVSGSVVLATLFAATAQVFNAVTPEAGLLHLIFNLFFLLLLWNTLAAGPAGGHLLRSLLVVFGSAFALKYIVLDALYDPAGGLAKRVLTTLLEGVSLGTLEYAPHAGVTGYVAFFTVLLYMIGLLLLSYLAGRGAAGIPADELVSHPHPVQGGLFP